MKFKKGDIVEACWNGNPNKIVFQLHSDAKFDYYNIFGGLSEYKTWWASGKHIGGRYKGIQCSVFHLDHCYLHNTFGLKKTIKGFNFNDKSN
jgi:hypothetical protein